MDKQSFDDMCLGYLDEIGVPIVNMVNQGSRGLTEAQVALLNGSLNGLREGSRVLGDYLRGDDSPQDQ
jgi:hypothetical protein